MYLLARCPSNGQQLMYGDVRLEDVEKLTTKKSICKGQQITNHLRFFKGEQRYRFFLQHSMLKAKNSNNVACIFHI